MQSTYEATIDRIIQKYEGGYGWNKKDRGGPTKYGITCFDLAEHRGKPMTSMTAWAPLVQAMTLDEAEDIYATKYAKGLHYADLRAGVDACMLDYAINSGVARPIHSACAILGIPSRGSMTDELVAAINKADPSWFINAMCQERLAFMHNIRGGTDWQEFGHGWQARVDDVERYGKALSATGQSPAPAPDLSKVPTPKATNGDPHAGKKAVTTVSGGPIASGIAHTAGAPPWVAIGIFVLFCVGAVAWFYWQQHRSNVANATVRLPPTIPPQPVPA